MTRLPVIVYPNPAGSRISVSCDTEPQSIRICDLLGRVVLHKENLSKPELDVSFLPAGMYLLQVQTSDGKHLTAKFVKE